jgi:hypothetical protein
MLRYAYTVCLVSCLIQLTIIFKSVHPMAIFVCGAVALVMSCVSCWWDTLLHHDNSLLSAVIWNSDFTWFFLIISQREMRLVTRTQDHGWEFWAVWICKLIAIWRLQPSSIRISDSDDFNMLLSMDLCFSRHGNGIFCVAASVTYMFRLFQTSKTWLSCAV